MSISVRRSFSVLGETLREDFNLVARGSASVDGWLARRGISKTFRSAAYIAVGVSLAAVSLAQPVQALGVAAFGVLQLTPFMLHNRHKRGNAVLGCALLAPQLLMLGAAVGALQVGIAGARAMTMNIIDDNSYRTRISVSTTFWLGTVSFAASMGLVTSPWALLPLAAMTCGTIADACPDKKTHIARLCHMTGAALLMPYHAFMSGSLGSLAGEVFGAVNLFRTAVQNDVPAKDSKGEMLTTRKQIAGWWRSVCEGQRIAPAQAGLPDPLRYPLRLVRHGRSGPV